MKTKAIILCLFISLNALAQFPAPTGFTLQGQYVLLGYCEFCLGPHSVCGPTYCSEFSWQAPTETTTTTLDHYNIYRNFYNEITLLFSVTSNTHWAEIAPQGDFWVTAVYTNPAGESLPSNIYKGWVYLPVSTNQVKTSNDNINYNQYDETLTLNSCNTVFKLNLINSNGSIIKSIQNPAKSTQISELPKGFYIVEVYLDNNKVIRQKIIK